VTDNPLSRVRSIVSTFFLRTVTDSPVDSRHLAGGVGCAETACMGKCIDSHFGQAVVGYGEDGHWWGMEVPAPVS
jgi:hypothetical protein